MALTLPQQTYQIYLYLQNVTNHTQFCYFLKCHKLRALYYKKNMGKGYDGGGKSHENKKFCLEFFPKGKFSLNKRGNFH